MSTEVAKGLLKDPRTEESAKSSSAAVLQRLDAICRGFHIDTLRPQLDACAETLKDGHGVDVAVVGRFKAGKSSFLNSLVARNLVPVAALPLTAVVTRVRYGARDRAVVRHLDDRQEEIPLDRLAEYVTEQRNPGNEKAVAIVDVETPSLEPYQGIRFVDTPGLGSVFAHNTRTAMDWLPRVSTARKYRRTEAHDGGGLELGSRPGVPAARPGILRRAGPAARPSRPRIGSGGGGRG